MRLLLPFIVSSSSYFYSSNKRAFITISENLISRRRNRIQLYRPSSSLSSSSLSLSLTSRRNLHSNYYRGEPKHQLSALSLLWNDHNHRRRLNNTNSSLTARKMSTTNDDNDENNIINDDKIDKFNQLLFSVPLIDVDCNLWHDDLIEFTITLASNDNDVVDCFTILQQDAVIESNIIGMISPSSTISQSIYGIQQLRLKQQQQQNHGMVHNVMIRTTVGIHPYHVNDEECITTDIDQLIFKTAHELILNNQDIVIGVGECGLDGSDGFPSLEQQIPLFAKQIQLCEKLINEYNNMKHLILFVHERLAFDTTFNMLQSSTIPSSNIIIHCFTGTVEEYIQYINAGYYISISGYIFRDNVGNNSVIDCLQQNLIPINRIMIETDSPYLGFINCRQYYIQKNENHIMELMTSKQRKKFINAKYPNVPSSLLNVLYEIVKHYNIGLTKQNKDILTVEEFAKHCTNNANSFFSFPTITK